jgi:hypothetical protein
MLGGGELRYVRTLFVAEDETCVHVFEARSREAVVAAAARGGLGDERIAEAIERAAPRPRPALRRSPTAAQTAGRVFPINETHERNEMNGQITNAAIHWPMRRRAVGAFVAFVALVAAVAFVSQTTRASACGPVEVAWLARQHQPTLTFSITPLFSNRHR